MKAVSRPRAARRIAARRVMGETGRVSRLSGTRRYGHATKLVVTGVPAACQGLSQVEVNVAVSRALHAAAAGVRGKDRQRQVIARDSPYVAGLIRAIPAAGPPT